MKITDEMVEAGAKVLWDDIVVPDNVPWEGIADDDAFKKAYRRDARAVLEAALAVAPQTDALQAIERVRALVHRRYTGSPGYENTPESVREIDAIRDGYSDRFADELLAAIGSVPEPVDYSGLIAEAREHYPALFRAPGARELIDRLADALEGKNNDS